ncbi:FecR domain-containing protein [Herminiimonas fonticola]|uniref:FecR family protein n=1 Tax=Herminiimonas fonticola TaxID=303380 RepID=A0A4R6G4U0_9BURK|nr:FecR domain-containing protein [Herminiimonas fonticola]RBA23037.1 Fe2+-dicitrate sensor membrane component [Herminiimonas fonticola]TDN89521.1 FecR family protein [Herminiimonas fonticola]
MQQHTLFAPLSDASEHIDQAIVKQAIVWLVTLQSGAVHEADRRACAAWRKEDARHEQAWQRLNNIGQDLRSGGNHVAPPLLRSVLRSADGNTRRMVLRSLLGLGVIGGSAVVIRQQPVWQTVTADHHTATGEQRHIVLADGTRIMLNTATAIDVRFNDSLRQIVLHRGEIMVTTAKDAAGRPFEVATSNGCIQPIGTRFTVRHNLVGSPSTTAVAVMEGAVNVAASSGDAVRVNAGEQTRFTAMSVLTPFVLDDSIAAWTDGVLVVERMRLADFLNEIDRYRKGVLRCDPAVADLLVSGSFPLHDTDAVLGLLSEILPLQVRHLTRYWTTIEAGKKTGSTA